jgi:hypothetical protein
MGLIKNVLAAAFVVVAAVKCGEYLVKEKVKDITGDNDQEQVQKDTREKFRGYGSEFRKGVEGFVEGVTDGEVSPDKKKENRVTPLEEMCLEADARNCPK